MGEEINRILSWSIAMIILIGMVYIFKGIGKNQASRRLE